jgi:hypothetical protein
MKSTEMRGKKKVELSYNDDIDNNDNNNNKNGRNNKCTNLQRHLTQSGRNSSSNFQTDSGGHKASYSRNIRVSSRMYSGCDPMLAIYLHQVPMLRMSAVIAPLLLYPCMTRTGTSFSR